MIKSVMGPPRRKSDEFREQLREQAGAIEALHEPEPAVEPAAVEVTAPARSGKGLNLQAIRAQQPAKEVPVQQPVRVPPSLKEDLDLICFALKKTKNDFMVEALKKEVAREKKRLGFE
jgi:hypothetical protein